MGLFPVVVGGGRLWWLTGFFCEFTGKRTKALRSSCTNNGSEKVSNHDGTNVKHSQRA